MIIVTIADSLLLTVVILILPKRFFEENVFVVDVNFFAVLGNNDCDLKYISKEV